MKLDRLNIILYIIINIIINIKNIFTVIAILLGISACTEVLFSDEEQTKTFYPGSFNAVIVEGTCNLVLIQDSADMVIVRGTGRIDRIEVISVNDTLFIKDKTAFRTEPGRNTIELHLTGISYLATLHPVNLLSKGALKGDLLSVEGIGEIAEGRLYLDFNSVSFSNSANTLGNIRLIGKADYLSVFNRYGSNVFADSLRCRQADITNESAGDVFVSAHELLNAFILGTGNIYYIGEPVACLKERKGSGQMINIR
jgi:hypothetical protein